MDSTTYSVVFDEATGEYIATAGNYEYATDNQHLAYVWLGQQILEDESNA